MQLRNLLPLFASAGLLCGCGRTVVSLHGSDASVSISGDGKGVTISSSGTEAVVSGVGDPIEENRSMPEYHAIDAGSVFEIEYKTGDKADFKISAQKNVLSHVKAEVRDGTLHLELKGSLNNIKPIKVTIENPHLDNLAVSGAATFHGTGISEEKLKLDVSGSGEATVEGRATDIDLSVSGAGKLLAEALTGDSINGDLSGSGSAKFKGVFREVKLDLSGAASFDLPKTDSDQIKLEIEGASNASISGKAKALTVSCSGGSSAELSDLVAQTCEATADGGSHVRINVERSLTATASGAANISYKGNPASVTPTSDGAASIGAE